MHARGLLSLSAAAALLSTLPAQFPPLAPTSNTTITTGGTLHYSSILIPAGVTVQFTGGAPAVVLCDGDCIVHGTLSVAAVNSTDGPGAVTNGAGAMGSICPPFCGPFGCYCWGFVIPGSAGVHHGVYGSAIPFSLMGGSPGGTYTLYSSSAFSCCTQPALVLGGGGGGTLVVIAGGLIEVDGVVDARGGSSLSNYLGSDGAILLRGLGGTLLRPSGQLLAGVVGAPVAQGGEVRLDAWGGPPLVQGNITAPAPVVLELPHLHASSAPAIGTTWSLDVFAPDNSIVFLAASTQPGISTPTPFGTLVIDLLNGGIVGTAATATGHDPMATIPWAIPNLPQLVGLPLWLQGLAWPPALAPRLTNAITAIVQ